MGRFLLFLTVLTTSLSVALKEFSIIHTVLFVLLFAFSFFSIFGENIEISLNKYYLRLIIVFGFSLFISLPINYIFNNDYYYYLLEPFGRVLNLLACFTIILFINSRKSSDNIIKWYFYSCLIISISAIWHALDLYTTLPVNFPFETRSLVHSSLNNYSFDSRLTGIAQEPSYLTSYLLDFWVLTLIVFYDKKTLLKIARIICLILIFLTYSPSAYISIIVLLLIEILMGLHKKNKLLLLVTLGLIGISIPIIFYLLNNADIEAWSYFTDRITNVSESGRFSTINHAIMSVINSENFYNLLIGNGLKSFELIQYKYYEIGVTTSNNLYVDVFFEAGLIGLSLLFSFYIYVLKRIQKIEFIKYRVFANLIFLNIVLSGFYRADYATLRYFILFYFIFIFINYRKYFYEK